MDLNNPTTLRDILSWDKHTRIEGLCSEAVFLEDVIQGHFSPIASDYWFVHPGYSEKYNILKVITDAKTKLNNLDYKILDGFASPAAASNVQDVQLIHFEEPKKRFCSVHHKSGTRYTHFADLGTPLPPAGRPEFAPLKDRDPDRHKKAADYLEARGLLKYAAIKRLFANHWLEGGVWDVDVFSITITDQVVAFEVKHKNATNANTFGMNDGQEKLYRLLTSLGMPVIHVILEKPANSLSISAVDLLQVKEYLNESQWLFYRMVPEKLRQAFAAAPPSTSIYGNKSMRYFHIPRKDFVLLKKLFEEKADIRQKLFDGLE